MKKILIISSVPTHPVIAGNRMWIKDNCKMLENLGCELHFLYVYVKPWRTDDADSIEHTRCYWNDRFYFYRASFIERLLITSKVKIHALLHHGYNLCDDKYPIFLQYRVKELLGKENFDACIVQYFYLTKVFEYIKGPIKVLATHDNFAYKDIVVNQRVIDCLDANQSAKAMQRSNVIFSLNEKEQIFFEMLSPRSKVYTVYSYYEYHSQPVVGNRNIMFLSGPSPFNLNGLHWFLSNIFPFIVEKYPDCKLIIGGSICEKLTSLSDNVNIVLQGEVDNIGMFYCQGDISINPTYQGTGLKTKTFEAVSYDKVEMAHPHSAIGIFKKEEAPIFFSENAEEWLNEIDFLWRDKNNIIKRKRENEIYIKSLQQYVITQYQDFLNHC